MEETLEEIKNQQGRKTELVSLILPDDYSFTEAVDLVHDERHEAINIKDKRVRKNVQSALGKIDRKLRGDLGGIPDNGVALYAGNVSDREGKTDIRLWTVVPENGTIQEKLYRCDKEFYTGPVEDVVTDTSIYAVVSIDYNEFTVADVRANGHIDIVRNAESNVPNKHKKGGQSQQRYERFREKRVENFLEQAGDEMQVNYLPASRNGDLNGIILAGPGQLKSKLRDILHNELEEEVIAKVDTNYGGPEAIREVVQKGQDILKSASYIKEQAAVEEFFENLDKDNGLSEYGADAVERAASYGAVETLLVPDGEDV